MAGAGPRRNDGARRVLSTLVLSRILGAIGLTLITAGTLILLFVAYQLWGTGLQEARSQNQLEDQFATILAEQQAAADTTTTTTTTTTTAPEDPDRIGLQQVDPVAADLLDLVAAGYELGTDGGDRTFRLAKQPQVHAS